MFSNSYELPSAYRAIDSATKASGFTMASDIHTGALLRTLAASKPGGCFLELGTGTGLSTAWILDGMDPQSQLVSVDNDETFLSIAREHLGHDPRLELVCLDGAEWFETNVSRKFDYIFADTWHGKYLLLDQALGMLNPGGLYIIDDMLPQPNWPEGHEEKAVSLVQTLTERKDLVLTKLNWSTGLVVAVRVSRIN